MYWFRKRSSKSRGKNKLKNTHEFFWNAISPKALILNVQIEDYQKILTQDEINDSIKVIKTKIKKKRWKNSCRRDNRDSQLIIEKLKHKLLYGGDSTITKLN